MNIQLVVVDPQNDFVKATGPNGRKGTLVVPGAEADMQRLATMITRIGPKLDAIHVTLDSHQTIGIERPEWWKRSSDGALPAPFTSLGIHPDGKRIVRIDFSTGAPVATEEEYTTRKLDFLHKGGVTGKGSFGYLQALAANSRYPHVVWTEHCIVGTWGWSIVEEVSDALIGWERANFERVNYVVKGNNPFTEHFSGVKAEVPDPTDPSTQINTNLIQTLETADLILLTGEALSHCVANTGRDIVSAFSDPKYVAKLVLLEDTTSNVGGFEWLGKGFLDDMRAKGMRVETSTSILS